MRGGAVREGGVRGAGCDAAGPRQTGWKPVLRLSTLAHFAFEADDAALADVQRVLDFPP